MESDFSRKIKELRLAKDMTLEQVANIVGVGKSTVRKWETGAISNMGRDKIDLLAKALCVTPAYLMGWDEPQSPGGNVVNIVEISERERELMSKFKNAPENTQEMLLQMVETLLNNLS